MPTISSPTGPSISIVPSLEPNVYKYDLRWALFEPQDLDFTLIFEGASLRQRGLQQFKFLSSLLQHFVEPDMKSDE